MRPADVLEKGETHVGLSVAAGAPLPPRDEGPRPEIAVPDGFVSEAQIRRGLGGDWEAGLRAGPLLVGLDTRLRLAGDEKWVTTAGLGLHAATLASRWLEAADRADAWRAGAEIELLHGRNWGDVLHVWLGPRAGSGRYSLADDPGGFGHAGLVAGAAAGWRWIFGAFELAAAWATGGGWSGPAVQPSFGLWARF